MIQTVSQDDHRPDQLAGSLGFTAVHRAGVNVALNQCATQHVFHLHHLEIRFGRYRHVALFSFKGGFHTLEVKPIGDDSTCLVNRVSQLVQIDFRYNVK